MAATRPRRALVFAEMSRRSAEAPAVAAGRGATLQAPASWAVVAYLAFARDRATMAAGLDSSPRPGCEPRRGQAGRCAQAQPQVFKADVATRAISPGGVGPAAGARPRSWAAVAQEFARSRWRCWRALRWPAACRGASGGHGYPRRGATRARRPGNSATSGSEARHRPRPAPRRAPEFSGRRRQNAIRRLADGEVISRL